MTSMREVYKSDAALILLIKYQYGSNVLHVFQRWMFHWTVTKKAEEKRGNECHETK